TDDGHPLPLEDPGASDHGAVRRGEPASEARRGDEVDQLRETHEVGVRSVQGDVLGERSPVGEARLLLGGTDLSVAVPAPLAATPAAHERPRHPIAAAHRLTCSPTSTTTPASSCPGTCGNSTSSWPAHACQSLRHTPVAITLTTTPSTGAGGSAT